MVDFPAAANQKFLIVGVAVSSKKLEALKQFLAHISADSGAVFLVLLPSSELNLMTKQLSKCTAMKVHQVNQEIELSSNSVYLIPETQKIVLKKNQLTLEPAKQNKALASFPLDSFFQSLALYGGDRSIGIILSGSADGATGLNLIDRAGGIALKQKSDSQEFAVRLYSQKTTDAIAYSAASPQELAQLVSQYLVARANFAELNSKQKSFIEIAKIQKITTLIKEREKLDFSRYKFNALSRRINRRCFLSKSQTTENYFKLLQNSAQERQLLCSDLLIKVTCFFRNPQTWRILQTDIVPSLLKNATDHQEFRFWVTACSTGEEAYSLAIIIDETLEQISKPVNIKIFATDIDRAALKQASQGIYSSSSLQNISPKRKQKYFVAQGEKFQVVKKLRQMLIFAPHDLTKDAGLTQMHFISCRNVLIYMQPNLQHSIVQNLHSCLLNKGILLLGEAGTLGRLDYEFQTIDQENKIYQKSLNTRLTSLKQNRQKLIAHRHSNQDSLTNSSQAEPLLEQAINLLLQDSQAVLLLVNSQRELIRVCGDGSSVLTIPQGKITQDVTKIVKAEFQLPLSTALYKVKQEKQPIIYSNFVITQAQEKKRYYRLRTFYISSQANQEFYLVEIKENKADLISSIATSQSEINIDAGKRVLDLECELQKTKEDLHNLVKELETINQEQQNCNEELITFNEELQSTNEELNNINSKYQAKIEELVELNCDVENLFKSTDIGVIFLDSELKIRKFTPAINHIISIRDTDLNRPLQELNYKFDYPNFIPLLQQTLRQKISTQIEIQHTENEQYFLMRLNPYNLEAQKYDGVVISLIKIDKIKRVQRDLKQALAALTHSENRLNVALSAGEIGTWIWEPMNDCLIWDDLLVALHEITPEQNPEQLQDWLGLIYPQDRQQVKQKITQLAEDYNEVKQKSFTVEYRLAKADNTISYFSTKGKIHFNEQQEFSHVVGVTIDITEIRETEQKLLLLNQELEQRVIKRTQSLAQFSDRLKQLHRLATTEYQTLESVFADYLQTGCQMFNLSTGIVSEVQNNTYKIVAVKSPLDLAVGFETHCQNTYCKEVVETQQTVTCTQVGKIDSMQQHPVYLNFQLESFIGTPIFVNGVLYGTLNFSDTVPRKQEFSQEELEIIELMAKDIEQFISSMQVRMALQHSEALFRTTFEQAATGMAHVSLDGKFLKVNQRLCEILGYTSDRLIKLSFPEITHPDDLDYSLKYTQQMLEGEIDSCSLEKRYIHFDGSTIWANLTISLIKNAVGIPQYFICGVEDISQPKAMAEALTKANESKDIFISQINHELRNPLNSILGFTQMLQKDLSLDRQQRQTVDLIDSSGKYLLTLINSILEFSKIEAGKSLAKQENFSLTQLIEDVAIIAFHRAKHQGLDFIYHLDSSVPTIVKSDQIKLQQLLLNLLDNAVKFTDTGTVTLNVYLIERSQSNDVFQVRFQIIDTGVGIAPEDRRKIFEPFVHLENNGVHREGTGLGLTISQKIAELLGSKLEFQSTLKQGSTFWFDLNLPVGKIELQKKLAPHLTAPPINCFELNKKILVVDDVADNRLLLTQYLNSLGFITTEANNGKQCLAIAEDFQPDIILLDILMPEMDGIETLKNIRLHPQLKETVVIFVSANSQLKTQLFKTKIKFEGFLTKPVDLQELFNCLQTHIALEKLKTDFEPNDSAMIPPEEEQLQELLELAQIGDMDILIKIANEALAQSESQYHPFLQYVSSLAEQFQQSQLINFISSAISA